MEIKKHRWKYHVFLLIVILFMHIFGEYVRENETFIKEFGFIYFRYILFFYIPFYIVYSINFLFLAPRTLSRKKIIQFVLGVLVLFFVFAGIRYLIEEIILFEITGKHNYYEKGRRLFYYVFDNSYYALTAVLYSTGLFLFFEFVKTNNRVHELELNHKKAELNLLKTQLEPHFLFNTLNSFYTELVDTRPETAKDIFKLSQLLRYVTYETQQDFMPLRRELQFIEDYIHFQRKRFEDNLFFEYQVEGIVTDQPIPSLVLIHFVENIFKHGILNDPDIPAKLNILITNQTLEVSTRNKVSASEKYSFKGIGEENLRRRLSAIYDGNYSLSFDKNDVLFSSNLKIPFKNI